MHMMETIWHALNSSFFGPILVSVILVMLVGIVAAVRIVRLAARNIARL
jgi:ABC-type antimicrobial peptide transport system permease subunit